MSEVQVVDAPAASTAQTPKPAANAAPQTAEGKINVTAYVVNGRLQLTADVGADEIAQLRDMLSKYEDILKMLN